MIRTMPFKTAERPRRFRFVRGLRLALASIGILSLGCAKLPPGQNNLSGKRIRVVMQFKTPLQAQAFYYFFVINKYGPQGTNNANGPIPVIGPAPQQNGGFGNGFVTGSSPSNSGSISGLPDYGVTDYVLYHLGQGQQGIGLYHFTADPNTQPLGALIPTQPLNVILPTDNINNPAQSTTLQFDLDMVQLVTDTNDPVQKIAEANQIRYLQINIIATNAVPISPTYNGLKEVDSMGDGRNTSELSGYLQIDLSQTNYYSSTQNVGLLSPEPTGDVYPPGSPDQDALDLVAWSVTVLRQ